MNDAPRHTDPGSLAAGTGLGRELTRLGELRSSSGARSLRVLFAALMALGVLALGAMAVLVIVGLVRADLAVVITGLVVGLAGVVIVGLTTPVAYGTLRSSLVIHENGLVAHHGVRGPRAIPWSEVASLQPPRNDGKYAAFYARLHTGSLVGVPRLKLTPRKDGRGGWVSHPDVALVLEHFATWCRRHGRPVAIRPLDTPGH